jgi:hypothetical protein
LRLVAAVLLMAALAGCGGGGGGGTPAERFAADGNAICKETAETSRELQRDKPPGYRAKLNAVGRDGQRRLKALVPPPELLARRNRFFADLSELERIGANPGERPRTVALTNRLPVEARALGWTDCAG